MSCEKYDTAKGIWKEFKPIPKPKTKFSTIVDNSGKIMLLGGKLMNGTRTDELELYDPIKDEWTNYPTKLSKGKSSHASVSNS